jgi:hypothetical protein
MSEVQARRYRRRSSRSRRREVRSAAISVVAAFVVVCAFVAAVLVLEPLNEPDVALLTTAGESVIAHDLDLQAVRDASVRAVYPFSVIPGGVYSPEELAAAVAEDPAVGAHYGDATPAAMHVETVDAPREAYMSYRIGDEIYWTKRKLALHEGERLLSDGSVTIRARCGNRLSDQPMQPTSNAEPPVQAFEGNPVVAVPQVLNALEPPLTLAAAPPMEPGMEPLSSSDPWDSIPFLGGIGAFGVGSVMSPLEEETVGSPVDEGTDPSIAFVFPPASGGDGHYSDEGPGRDPPGGEHHEPPSVIVEVPGLTTLNPPSDDHPFDSPPLGGPETLGGGSDAELPPPVVPEPTSLTLFGTGAVWMAIKRYRQDKRRGRP